MSSYQLQLGDEVLVGGQPANTRGWLTNIRGAQCKVFSGDGYMKHVDMSRIQLRSRSRPTCVAWILEAIARVLQSENITDEPIPRMNFESLPPLLQKQVQELTRSCSFHAFKLFVLSCQYVDEQNTYVNNLQQQQDELKLAVGRLTRTKITQAKQIRELEDRRDILDQLVSELTSVNSQMELEKDKLDLEKTEYSSKLFQISNQHDDLAEISSETIRKLEADRNRMLHKIEQLTKACQQSNIELEELELKHQKNTYDLASVKNVRDNLVAENFQLKGSATSLTRECERFQQRNKTLVHEKNETQQRFDALKTRHIHLDEDYSSTKLKVEGLDRNVKKLSTLLKEKNDLLGKMQIENEESRLKIESRDNRIHELLKFNNKTTQDGVELKQTLYAVQDEYRNYRGEMEPKHNSLEAHCRNLEEELSESESRIKTLVNDNVTGSKRIEDLLNVKSKLDRRVNEQSLQLTEHTETISGLEQNLNKQGWQNNQRSKAIERFLGNNMVFEDAARSWEDRCRIVEK